MTYIFIQSQNSKSNMTAYGSLAYLYMCSRSACVCHRTSELLLLSRKACRKLSSTAGSTNLIICRTISLLAGSSLPDMRGSTVVAADWLDLLSFLLDLDEEEETPGIPGKP